MDSLVVIVGVVITVLTAIPVVVQLRNHPRGLFILFFAEMWERFSYYGMRGLLILYLTQQFLFDDTFAQGQYGAYTALVYLLPLIGGLLADKILGTRKAIAFGALLLVAGHLAMAIEGKPAVQVLTYQGASYDFNVAGKGDKRHVQLKVGDGLYDYGPAASGGLEIKGLPANAALPSVLAKDSYKLTVKNRSPLFTNILYLALSLIIMGVGFLKANISSIVGQLYSERDPRRDPGFTLYYYGINLGAFWASILCGGLGQTFGWSWGFGLAGIGMLAGFIVFVLGKPLLQGKGEPPSPERLKKPMIGPINTEWSLYLLGLLGVGVVWGVLLLDGKARAALGAAVEAAKETSGKVPALLAVGDFFALVGTVLLIASVAVLGYLGWFMNKRCTKVERERLGLALVLIAASVVFWTLFEQAGGAMNQFAERNTDLSIGFGRSITASQAQSFNSGFILIGAPIFSWIWASLGRRGADPNPVFKFSLGLVQAGLSFILLAWGGSFADAAFKVPLLFLFFAYALQTTGELCLSPVGLSQMTKLSVTAVLSTVMAVWFLASAWAQWLAAAVGKLTATETIAGQVLDPAKALAGYVQTFFWLGIVGIGIGAALFALSPWLKRWAHGASDTGPLEAPGELEQVVEPRV